MSPRVHTDSSVEEALLARSIRDDATGCLRWTGAKTSIGYGVIRVRGEARYVHRLAHEFWVGPIPDDYVVDHVADRGCRFRDCIEPSHLEAVTQAENLRRGEGFIGVQSRTTHCPQGHEYNEENTMLTKRGERRCRTCNRERQKRTST